ncbi:MAG: family metallophosphoesterase, partial [Hyphomicrobiales bacterium]|nr:family metallophosphoesterase [Hyphomicrobiales bacterium]
EMGACPLGHVCDALLLDIHAETTSEKMSMGHFCDGRARLDVGTHTHIPTADYQILPGGTAYQSDAGMTGDYDSVIGLDKEEPLLSFSLKIPGGRFEPSDGAATVCGLAVDIDDSTGLARAVGPLRMGGRLAPALPDFWES